MDTSNMEYRHGVTDANQTTSNLAQGGRMGFTATVGQGSIEVTSGHGMTQSKGVEYHTTPSADALTGYTFSTEAGHPVPAGGPRLHDMVNIGGMKVKVAQAIRDGLIPDPSRMAPAQPQSAPYSAPHADPHVNPYAAPESLADGFTADVLPRVSPATINSIEADLAEGQFSEKTLDYLMLEGNQSPQALAAVRDAYAAKVTAATGMTEAELQDVWQSDRKSFNAAVSEMLKTGSTAGFQALAEQADAAAWTPLETDAALTAWRSPDFPEALIDAGLEPIFDGGEVSINIPGKGIVRWTDAVRKGLVGVSRR
jgi:hypothetical protein